MGKEIIISFVAFILAGVALGLSVYIYVLLTKGELSLYGSSPTFENINVKNSINSKAVNADDFIAKNAFKVTDGASISGDTIYAATMGASDVSIRDLRVDNSLTVAASASANAPTLGKGYSQIGVTVDKDTWIKPGILYNDINGNLKTMEFALS